MMEVNRIPLIAIPNVAIGNVRTSVLLAQMITARIATSEAGKEARVLKHDRLHIRIPDGQRQVRSIANSPARAAKKPIAQASLIPRK